VEEKEIDRLLAQYREIDAPAKVERFTGRRQPLPLRCAVAPPRSYDRTAIESDLHVTLPEDLTILWERTSELRLFEDIRYGQWGLVIWGPAETVRMHPEEIRGWEEDWREGDLLVGRFLGDADRMVVRCNADAPDFGSVLIRMPIDPRKDWPHVGSSLREFLGTHLARGGDKFWEP